MRKRCVPTVSIISGVFRYVLQTPGTSEECADASRCKCIGPGQLQLAALPASMCLKFCFPPCDSTACSCVPRTPPAADGSVNGRD